MKKLKKKKKKKLKLFLDSVYNITKDTNHPIILIRFLSELDEENAIELYTFYKTYAEEFNDNNKIKDFIDDFIYEIFEDDILDGCVIKSIKKFKINDEENKINTFYIQEIFINTNNTEKKYEDYLFNYIIKKGREQYINPHKLSKYPKIFIDTYWNSFDKFELNEIQYLIKKQRFIGRDI